MALQILYFIPGNLQAPAAGFDAIVGRLLVSPVLQVLVFGNARQEVRQGSPRVSPYTPVLAALPLDMYPHLRNALARHCTSQQHAHAAWSSPPGCALAINRVAWSGAAQTRRWVDDIMRWSFKQVIPCHFAAPLKAGPRELRCADAA